MCSVWLARLGAIASAAGVDAAGVDAAGVDAAGVDAAGVDAAGVDAAGVDAAGVDAAQGEGYRNRSTERFTKPEEMSLTPLAFSIAEGCRHRIENETR